jgi:mersacidin/lichenicidin family type 2 lantibiotic
MNLEEIIRAWKSAEETVEPHSPASPVGEELSEEELFEIDGGFCISTCRITCANFTCFYTD